MSQLWAAFLRRAAFFLTVIDATTTAVIATIPVGYHQVIELRCVRHYTKRPS